jgi:hypothetical protein
MKKQQELSLVNIGFQQDIDFHVELNKKQHGVVVRCKCGIKYAISQKQGVFFLIIFSLLVRLHYKKREYLTPLVTPWLSRTLSLTYSHKQAATWLLSNDKSTLSSDRLKRVTTIT